MIKEAEIDTLAIPWVNSQVAYLLVVWQATATMEDDKSVKLHPCDYNEIVTTKEAETIDAFSSSVIYAKTKTAHQGEAINVMTQPLCVEDGSLPQGLCCVTQILYIKNNLCFGLSSIYFLYPLTSLPKMVKQEVPASIEQDWIFVLWPCVGPPLSSVINKRGMLAKLCMMMWDWHVQEAVCSKASLTLETTGEQRTTSTRHR